MEKKTMKKQWKEAEREMMERTDYKQKKEKMNERERKKEWWKKWKRK